LLCHLETERARKGKDRGKVEAVVAVEWQEIGPEQVPAGVVFVRTAEPEYPISEVLPVIL
jgi:hypothetical protein